MLLSLRDKLFSQSIKDQLASIQSGTRPTTPGSRSDFPRMDTNLTICPIVSCRVNNQSKHGHYKNQLLNGNVETALITPRLLVIRHTRRAVRRSLWCRLATSIRPTTSEWVSLLHPRQSAQEGRVHSLNTRALLILRKTGWSVSGQDGEVDGKCITREGEHECPVESQLGRLLFDSDPCSPPPVVLLLYSSSSLQGFIPLDNMRIFNYANSFARRKLNSKFSLCCTHLELPAKEETVMFLSSSPSLFTLRHMCVQNIKVRQIIKSCVNGRELFSYRKYNREMIKAADDKRQEDNSQWTTQEPREGDGKKDSGRS